MRVVKLNVSVPLVPELHVHAGAFTPFVGQDTAAYEPILIAISAQVSQREPVQVPVQARIELLYTSVPVKPELQEHTGTPAELGGHAITEQLSSAQ